MFICTCRLKTVKFFSVICAALLILGALIIFVPDYSVNTTAAISEANEKLRFDRIRTNEERVAFLNQYGWEVEESAKEEVKVTVPSDFDKILDQYNELQKQQGLDLTKYRGKDAVRYTYTVKNYPGYSGTVYANIIVYKNRVIAGDICSADVSGFVTTLYYPKES